MDDRVKARYERVNLHKEIRVTERWLARQGMGMSSSVWLENQRHLERLRDMAARLAV